MPLQDPALLGTIDSAHHSLPGLLPCYPDLTPPSELSPSKLSPLPTDEKTVLSSDEILGDPLLQNADVLPASQRLLETFDHASNHQFPIDKPFDLGFIPLRHIGDLGTTRAENVDYRLVGQLGAGGTGVVFQAHQRAVDREVAVKMLRHELASRPHSRERFLAEARVIGGLDHPNVIALHEVYSDKKGSLFYSMKRIDGTSWDKQISTLSPNQNVEILLRIADAIRYAHSRGLVHRDIKPENVMLGKFGEVLLADWGLAINLQEAGNDINAKHSIGGTPAYMAPELASASAGSISFQSDVYLLGAILYQIQTGRPPHHGESLSQCLQAAANNVIQPTEVDGELIEIAMRAMATVPKDRYANVDDFIDAIKNQRQHEQSERLLRRALRQVEQSDGSSENGDVYRDFGIADALLDEAIETWPDNAKVRETRKRLKLKFAAIATERGDYDLAASIYEATGESDSDEAQMVRFHRMRRDASQVQVSRYSVLFTQSPDPGLLVQMKSSKIVEANIAFAKMFGYAGDQVVGQRIEELNLWVCSDQLKTLVAEVRRNGTVDDFAAQLLHTNGTLIDVVINSRVVKVLGEKMFLSTIRDVSQRTKAENDLKHSQARLRDLQQMAGLATWSYDVQTRLVTWNNEAFELAGRAIEEGTPTREEYVEMCHPEDRDRLQNALDLSIESGAGFEMSVRQRGPGGECLYVKLCGQPIHDNEGNTIEVYGILMERPQRNPKANPATHHPFDRRMS